MRQLTNASGAITDAYDYDAFGNLIYRSGTTPNDYLYSGEQLDANLGDLVGELLRRLLLEGSKGGC